MFTPIKFVVAFILSLALLAHPAQQHRRHPHPHPAPAPVMQGPAIASWYYDQGYSALGCGFYTPYYGIATLIAPCGTKFQICAGARCIVATRDDSGPYVYGRTFDLGINAHNVLCPGEGLCSVRWRIVK